VLIDVCPICRREGIHLPGGGVMCGDHGVFDAEHDRERFAIRRRRADRAAAESWALYCADDSPR